MSDMKEATTILTPPRCLHLPLQECNRAPYPLPLLRANSHPRPRNDRDFAKLSRRSSGRNSPHTRIFGGQWKMIFAWKVVSTLPSGTGVPCGKGTCDWGLIWDIELEYRKSPNDPWGTAARRSEAFKEWHTTDAAGNRWPQTTVTASSSGIAPSPPGTPFPGNSRPRGDVQGFSLACPTGGTTESDLEVTISADPADPSHPAHLSLTGKLTFKCSCSGK